MKKYLVLAGAVMCLLLSACSGGASAAPAGDPEKGKALFHQATIETAPACQTCHSTEPDTVIVGPSLAGVARRAGERLPAVDASDYLRASILSPDSFVTPGFSPGVMYPDFENVLSDEQMDDLVAYLLTLK